MAGPSTMHRRPRRAGEVRVLVVGILVLVAAGAALVLFARADDATADGDREDHCAAPAINVEVAIEHLGPTATPDQRRAAASTLALLYPPAFADGAPASAKAAAERFVDLVDDLDGATPLSPAEAAALRATAGEVEASRASVCGQ